MKLRQILTYTLMAIILFTPLNGAAGLFTSAARDVAEYIFSKFGKGAAGDTVAGITAGVKKYTDQFGNNAVRLLRSSGHDGYRALEMAGDKAPDVIKLYIKRGDESLWVISQPKRLVLFLKHGDSAAEALIKHRDIADNLIERFGDDAATALNTISRPNGQRLAMLADDGLLSASAKSPELLPVIRQYGDEAMEFIWKNKGALAVAAVLGSFLVNPQAYITGVQELVQPIFTAFQWVLTSAGMLGLGFIAAFIFRRRTRLARMKDAE